MPARKNEDIFNIHDYNINVQAREIFLYDEIDCDSAMKFIKNLKLLEKISSKPITIHQYSTGGEWASGMAIYDAIYFSSCPFLFLTYGCAASMGSVIPQAVLNKGYRVTTPNCDWLVHEGYIAVDNTVRAVSSLVDADKRTKSKMYDIYTECFAGGEYFKDQPPKKIRSYIRSKLATKEDWYLTSEEAVYYGLADAVLGSQGYETINSIIESM